MLCALCFHAVTHQDCNADPAAQSWRQLRTTQLGRKKRFGGDRGLGERDLTSLSSSTVPFAIA